MRITRKEEKLRYKYKITEEEYWKISEAQNHVCAICGSEELNKLLAVDHDHITGEVRGLLCTRCNIGLGCFRDNVELLNRAILYLDEYYHYEIHNGII